MKGREHMEKNTIPVIIKKKQENQKITMLTAYDYNIAALIDQAGIDIILVGDSLANVFAGRKNTLNVTMQHMVYHVEAVARGVENALVVADMPFGSFQVSPDRAFENAAELVRSGAQAVKIEGGGEMVSTVEYLTRRGIPVMAHIGLQPQSVHAYGGYRVQGKEAGQAKKLQDDALALEKAGAFAIVIEAIPASLAAKITSSLTIPVIGIGAGKDCDGQVLVINDLLGLSLSQPPRFVKQYADLKDNILKAVQMYRHEVQKGIFPEKKHTYGE